MGDIVDYYEMTDEGSRFSRNSRKIEFLTTTHVLNKLMPRTETILDVGAGPGTYAFYYAKRDQQVTAVDIVPKHIEEIHRKRNETGLNVRAYVEDATNLSRFRSASFDLVLCLGPLYHIVNERDRRTCIEECLRVLKPGGYLAVAYINKYSIIPMLSTRDTTFIRPSVIHQVINEGVMIHGTEDCFWTDAHFTDPEEIELLLASYPVRTIDHVGTDGISHTIAESIDKLTDNEFESWMDYHMKTCRERSILGMSSHGLYVCQKL